MEIICVCFARILNRNLIVSFDLCRTNIKLFYVVLLSNLFIFTEGVKYKYMVIFLIVDKHLLVFILICRF